MTKTNMPKGERHQQSGDQGNTIEAVEEKQGMSK